MSKKKKTKINNSKIAKASNPSSQKSTSIKQNVTFIGNETLELAGKKYETIHFNFSSDDNKLNKDKKLNTDIWYEKKSLNWVKASFYKKGKWEYRLLGIK